MCARITYTRKTCTTRAKAGGRISSDVLMLVASCAPAAIRSTFIKGKIYEGFSTRRSCVSGTPPSCGPACTDTRMTRLDMDARHKQPFSSRWYHPESTSTLHCVTLLYCRSLDAVGREFPERETNAVISARSYHWTRTKDWNGRRSQQTGGPVPCCKKWKIKEKRPHFSFFLYLELYHTSLDTPSNFSLSISQRDFLI